MKIDEEIRRQKDLIRYTEGICSVLGPGSIINELLPTMRERLTELEKKKETAA